MKLVIDIKYFLIKSAVLFACFFLTAFTIKSDKNELLNADTVVSVMQENDALTISVKTSKNINIRFYMFTVEGRLIKELNIYGSKRISITQLEKGIYIYDFFSNDERLKNGKIELR
ncbi:MAG: hypothetical protein JWO92_1075 [Chitinophagaceae bacterium]|nr:hypothetical protein [Chitinophagaceae bacterium]